MKTPKKKPSSAVVEAMRKNKTLRVQNKALKQKYAELVALCSATNVELHERKEAHNQLAQASEKLLTKDKLLEGEVNSLKAQVTALTKVNADANDTITKLAGEKKDLEQQRHGLQETVKSLDAKIAALTTAETLPESEVVEVPTNVGNGG